MQATNMASADRRITQVQKMNKRARQRTNILIQASPLNFNWQNCQYFFIKTRQQSIILLSLIITNNQMELSLLHKVSTKSIFTYIWYDFFPCLQNHPPFDIK